MIDAQRALASLLPISIAGWTAEPAEDQLFDPETIFDYIDGAGEVYRSYNFRLLLSRRYRRPGSADIVADVFDMGSGRDAFGVFTHDLEGEDAGLGQGSTYKGGLLSLWRDRYFVSLTAEAETEENKKALFALGGTVAANIARDGEKPDLLRFLPDEFQDPRSVHYFHTQPVLNYHFFISSENFLGLGPETEALLASSPAQGATKGVVLILVRYPGPDPAAGALKDFVRGYMPDAAREQNTGQTTWVVRAEDGMWTAAAASENVLVLVFQSPSGEAVRALLQKVITGPA